ncbi:MAG TPA: zinc-dependent alcohol dehydrogenase family protein [Parafilimonas sp.]|nr:zinc-dependent alcohol dehydrogenase family protein [Parafilimonas sp.]
MNVPSIMQAMVLERQRQPLVLKTLNVPAPASKQVLVKIIACGVCRTDLHITDGELTHPKLPLTIGHEIVGIVAKKGDNVTGLNESDIVGIPWLGYTCGKCKFCLRGKENLCENALFTGYTIDGGYAEYTVAYAKYCFSLNKMHANASGAPLLCAGLIGYRSFSMIDKNAESIGIYGFGAAAHLITQAAVFLGKKIYAFTRDGDTIAQQFALGLGAVWAGDSSKPAPVKLDAAIIFAPVGSLVPKALEDVDKGGTVICGGIHMSNIPSFSYNILWEERSIRSVANLTRKDGEEFLKLAAEANIKTETKLFQLQQANEALQQLREGRFTGAAVLMMPS